MDSSDEDLAIAICISAWCVMKEKKKRRMWLRPYLVNRYMSDNILNELKIEDRFGFKNFLRMSESDFNFILSKVERIIYKKDTHLRAAIPAPLRLGICLRFLATGDSYTSLMYLVKVSKQAICKIIPEVCEAIIKTLMKEYLQISLTEDFWNEKAKGFLLKWNFHHCVGAMDGKHVLIDAPANSGSLFFNYKQTYSFVLLAVVDAFYNFVYIDVGCQGRISDSGVFRHTDLWTHLENDTLNFPPKRPLPGREKVVSCVLVADEAFPLTNNILKPYSGSHDRGTRERIFNYRLSRARNVVENAFGILSSVFRVFRKPLALNVDTAVSVVLTSTILHNFLRRNSSAKALYSPPGSLDVEDTKTGNLIPGSWRSEGEPEGLCSLQEHGGRYSFSAKETRDEFATFFLSKEGAVPWQNVS